MDGRKYIALLLVIPLLGMASARAAPVSYVGPYAGGDELMAMLDPRRPHVRANSAWDERNMGWKGMVGVRVSRRFALEAGFTDFGRGVGTSPTANSTVRARTKAFTAFGVASMPVGPVEMFAKAGPTRMQSLGHVRGAYFDEQDKKIAYGAGLQWTRNRWTVRAEYERFGDSRVGNLNSVALGFKVSLRQR
jgi:hypothetical protein